MALYTSQAAANKRQKTVRDVSSRTNVAESMDFFAGNCCVTAILLFKSLCILLIIPFKIIVPTAYEQFFHCVLFNNTVRK